MVLVVKLVARKAYAGEMVGAAGIAGASETPAGRMTNTV